MASSVKHASEPIDGNPMDKFRRIGDIESTIQLQYILIHHDVIVQVCTGRTVFRKAVCTVHNRSKTIQVGFILDDIATIFIF